MSANPEIRAKLGKNVFKEGPEFHIRIRPGRESDPRLALAVKVCPAGLYSLNESGRYEIDEDGCLECGTCLIACGPDVLEWDYPEGGAGVQFRFG